MVKENNNFKECYKDQYSKAILTKKFVVTGEVNRKKYDR